MNSAKNCRVFLNIFIIGNDKWSIKSVAIKFPRKAKLVQSINYSDILVK